MGHRHGRKGLPRPVRSPPDIRGAARSAVLPAFKPGAGDKRESAFGAVACMLQWPSLGGYRTRKSSARHATARPKLSLKK